MHRHTMLHTMLHMMLLESRWGAWVWIALAIAKDSINQI